MFVLFWQDRGTGVIAKVDRKPLAVDYLTPDDTIQQKGARARLESPDPPPGFRERGQQITRRLLHCPRRPLSLHACPFQHGPALALVAHEARDGQCRRAGAPMASLAAVLCAES